jgi:hypothetical protein
MCWALLFAEVHLTTSLLQPTDTAPPSPLVGLIRSRKFWLMTMDLVLSVVGYFVGKYAGPSVQEDVKFLTLTLQPVIIFLIYTIADEDKARTRANADIAVAAHQASAAVQVVELAAPAA